jgi:hypothetical protein
LLDSSEAFDLNRAAQSRPSRAPLRTKRERVSEQKCGHVTVGDFAFLHENNRNQGSQGQWADCIVLAGVTARNANEEAIAG